MANYKFQIVSGSDNHIVFDNEKSYTSMFDIVADIRELSSTLKGFPLVSKETGTRFYLRIMRKLSGRPNQIWHISCSYSLNSLEEVSFALSNCYTKLTRINLINYTTFEEND